MIITDNSVEVTIKLTLSEWCEVANAITDKATDVRRHRYGSKDDQDFDPDEWAEELDSAYRKVTKELDQKGINY